MVQVRAPFPGKLLLTVEREGVLDTQVHTLTGNTATIEVPMRGEYRPNAYITATLVPPRGGPGAGLGRPRLRGRAAAVDRAANHLTPQIVAPEISARTARSPSR